MKPFLLLLALGQGADAASTVKFLHEHTACEANPMVIGNRCSLGTVAPQMFAWLTLEQLALARISHNHPKLAKSLAMVSFTMHSSAAAYNLRRF